MTVEQETIVEYTFTGNNVNNNNTYESPLALENGTTSRVDSTHRFGSCVGIVIFLAIVLYGAMVYTIIFSFFPFDECIPENYEMTECNIKNLHDDTCLIKAALSGKNNTGS